MAVRDSISLAQAPRDYDVIDQDRLRRDLERELQTLDVNVDEAKLKTDKAGSLAMRRFQFLLMGAS